MSRGGSQAKVDSSVEESPRVISRGQLIGRLRDHLFGPRGGSAEWIHRNDPPHKRYLVGVLFPRETGGDEEEDTGTVVAGDGDDGPDDSPLAAMLQRAPASAGMTFSVTPGSGIRIRISGAEYVEAVMPGESATSAPRGFLRRQLPDEVVDFVDGLQGDSIQTIWSDRAEIRCRWRMAGPVRIITISIVNRAVGEVEGKVRPEECIFQVGVEVRCVTGTFAKTPAPDVPFDAEEAELRLRYRRKVAWATGHSCSVDWENASTGAPAWIRMEFLPTAELRPFSPGVRAGHSFDEAVLSPEWLAAGPKPGVLRKALEAFVADFDQWMGKQATIEIESVHQGARDRILARLRQQSERLHHGILHLCNERFPERLQAFALANKAMLDQMRVTAVKSGRPFDPSRARWRPFQLAFQLLAIPGTAGSEPDDHRDLVDLIWFPTGGGKTEAYLLLSAFAIIWRRLVHGEAGCGTAVISRYTLRLLTNQQFERTAALACALEHMRRAKLIPGKQSIDVGLWIGGGKDSSPNTFRDAKGLAEEVLAADRPENRFMLRCCPWCGKALVPAVRSENRKDYGFEATAASFLLRCTRPTCEFKDRLPVQVVDEALYASPPAVLLGTVDKFARLPWESRSRSFFGFVAAAAAGGDLRPPDLVIQDELHLISGPLGTIAAIYEAGMDVVASRGGPGPKYIAATATIRGAQDQAHRLYGRQVAVFPSPGVDCDDSFFMFMNNSESGSRLYMGVMGQGHTPVTATVHTMAAMLEAGATVTTDDDYWTIVVYHNSRRELGKTMTLARDDVHKRIHVIAPQSDTRLAIRVAELSSNVPSYQIPRVIHDAEQRRESGDPIDVLACTSMISVGVDISRLNAMLVLGQPKTTAEYIQASSRVGRATGAAGFVLMNCVATKPRDRAHFENFLRYHESIYRWVEPSSVTPNSPEALRRALHASLILAVRLQVLTESDRAGAFDPIKPEVGSIIDALRCRLMRVVDELERPVMKRRFDEVVAWWIEAAKTARPLHYKAEAQFEGLMRFPNQDHQSPSRATLNSMRNVDGEVACKVVGGME
jgi:hypothetical protein